MNNGYQLEDSKILDYSLWRIPGVGIDLRGPVPALKAGGYIVAIGAAQTFGRFVSKPYATLLSERLGVPVLNLGVSGAGPSFFLQRPELLDVINRAKLAIVQVMSGRSSTNSKLEVQANQGVVKRVGAPAEEKGMFAETAYYQLLEQLPLDDLAGLRAEIRARALTEMQALLRRITVPRALLWFSTREPDYSENLRDLSGFWGGFPHFLNKKWLDSLASEVEVTVMAVSRAGLPQPLFDRISGEPVKLWSENKFPSVKLRHHNHYYPSPEMHKEAADALERPVAALLGRLPTSFSAPAIKITWREVLVHFHIFKSGGMSLDAMLRQSFGGRFAELDPVREHLIWTEVDLLRNLQVRPELRCVASHQLRQPLLGNSSIRLFPFFILRHPIDRLRSVYEYERRPDRRATFRHKIGDWANELDFKHFYMRCKEFQHTRRLISNFQTGQIGHRNDLQEVARDPMIYWSEVAEKDLLCALRFMESLPVVGVLERFDESIIALKKAYSLNFPELLQRSAMINVSRKILPLPQKLAEIEAELGSVFYQTMLQDNAMDLALWQAANAKLDAIGSSCTSKFDHEIFRRSTARAS